MKFQKHAKGTIAFVIMMTVGQIWMAVSPVYESPWEPWAPIVPFMAGFAVPFMQNFFRPVLIVLAGVVILWVWEDRRAGYSLALMLATIASAFGVIVILLNALNQEWLGTLTGIFAAALPAFLLLWYSFQGFRNNQLEP